MSDKASEFIAVMEQAKQLAHEAAQQANLAGPLADEGAELFAQGGNANSHAMMAAAAESARRMVAEATAVTATADEAISQATQAKGLPTGGSATVPPQTGTQPGAVPGTSARTTIAGFTHRRPVGEAVEAIRRTGWPRNTQGQVSARGHLYDRHGTPISGTLQAHRKNAAPPCDDLKEPWRSDPNYTTTWHAERDAAKLMRDNQLDYAVLYLNVATCGRESRDPKRCDANIENIMPRGAELYVWTIHQDGSRARRRYEGNGDAIHD